MIHPNELDQQIENLRTLQQSYDQIAGAAEAYNVGKTQLAQAITSKGVETSPTESYPEMAEKVLDIQQRTIDITAPNWYGGQIGANGYLWDLYAVLADMKNRFMGADQYACLIVCEYYKGYDSLQLQGADAYYTCDGDFYDVSSPLHTWHDSDNGKANRWVCFLFATDGARLDITNTAISPRAMYIGGHVGTIEYFTDGRLTEIVCGIEETDIIDNFLPKNYNQLFDNNLILRNIRNFEQLLSIDSRFVIIESLEHEQSVNNYLVKAESANHLIISGLKKISSSVNNIIGIGKDTTIGVTIKGLNEFTLPALNSNFIVPTTRASGDIALQFIDIRDLEESVGNLLGLYTGYSYTASNLIDIIVGQYHVDLNYKFWNPTTVLADSDKKAKLIDNIKNHILARVSDATGGTQLVFTVSTNMYNNIASEQIEWQGETMSLADAFLTKNWLLAGA